jgi:hypothetical protein
MNIQRTSGKSAGGRPGMTLIELLIGGTIMLVVILAALTLYVRSNKVAVDQSQVAEIQSDVRSSMYFLTRDVRMAGVGLPYEFNPYYLEGTDNEEQGGVVEPDRIKIMGNIDDPLNLRIQNYQGASVVVSLDDFSFEAYPYSEDYYHDKIVLILPNPMSGCRAGEIRSIGNVTHNPNGTNERMNFPPGLAIGINAPGGLSGTCADSDDYDGGLITFIDVKEYWLDVTGNAPGLSADTDGYIGGGQGGVFYMTLNAYHYPLARNIENFQVVYRGDWDGNGTLDDDERAWLDWDPLWNPTQVSRITEVRFWLLGCTEKRMVAVGSAQAPADIYLYRRPPIANSPGMAADDFHKRFLMESMVNIRNISFNVYNMGQR